MEFQAPYDLDAIEDYIMYAIGLTQVSAVFSVTSGVGLLAIGVIASKIQAEKGRRMKLLRATGRRIDRLKSVPQHGYLLAAAVSNASANITSLSDDLNSTRNEMAHLRSLLLQHRTSSHT